MKFNTRDAIVVAAFCSIVVLTRVFFSIAPNVEFITALTFTGVYFYQRMRSVFMALILSLFISDLLIGNTDIFIFTWSGFFAIFALGLIVKSSFVQKLLSSLNKYVKNVLLAFNFAIVSTFLFFFWTNFGVVLTTNMYAKSLEGLFNSYVNALPFLYNQLLANIVLLPLFAVCFTYFTKPLQRLFNNENQVFTPMAKAKVD